jgi:hypothetical protein
MAKIHTWLVDISRLLPLRYFLYRSHFSVQIASKAFSSLSFVAVARSLFLVYHALKNRNTDGLSDLVYMIDILIIMGFSYPVLFLIDRGNIDGITLLFISLGLFWIGKYDIPAGVAFAVAVAFKLYPTLIIFPLIALRQRKALLSMLIAMALLILLTPHLWIEVFQRAIPRRIAYFVPGSENASISSSLYLIGRVIDSIGHSSHYVTANFLRSISYPIWLMFLLSMYFFDAKQTTLNREEIAARMAMYIPFMVALPQLSIQYELVCVLIMIPIVCWYWEKASKPGEYAVLLFIILGIWASQFQAVAFAKLSGYSSIPYMIPGFGLLMVMVGIVAYKLTRENTL